jgi:hypothetical protein
VYLVAGGCPDWVVGWDLEGSASVVGVSHDINAIQNVRHPVSRKAVGSGKESVEKKK